ncbi:MotE family protein [Jannaschia marina]|uniref:MotE family protein n=1 Tax=Jannaschia marina TaxID=2741674 RepID=UPI0015CD19C7|nr:hypothetical protein [Jannaschia marina]
MIRLLRRFGALLLVSVLLVSALTRIVSAGLVPDNGLTAEATAPLPVSTRESGSEVGDLIREITRRSEALDARETAVALREQDIAVARQEVEAALLRLDAAEARLAARMHQSSAAAETDVTQLVRVYEGMKPKDAAVLFEAMDPTFAAGFLARMNADAASALFSNLSPDRAYALSVLMAGRNANAATE